MRVEILASAENDLEAGFHFYESQSPGLGLYFLDSLFAEIDSLAFYAGSHPTISGTYRHLAGKFPFAVYYRIINNVAIVIAVLDCRSKPSWIRKKLMNT